MYWARIVNGSVAAYPYTEQALREDHPNVSFCRPYTAESLAPFGVVEVADVAPPAYDAETETVEEQTPEYVGGIWRRKWLKRAVTPAELVARTPPSVRPHQLQLALLDAGLLDTLITAISNLTAAQKRRAQIVLDRCPAFDRDSTFINQMRTLLGLTESQMDALFRAATKL